MNDYDARYELDLADAQELAAIDRCTRRYQSALARHSDCRDPDHPGCPHCEGEEE